MLDRFRKKKDAWHFLYQRAGEKGWIPIDKYDSEVAAEDLEPMMTEAGTYILQKRTRGRIVGTAWSKKVEGSAEVVAKEIGEERVHERAPESDRVAKAIEDDMVRAVRWFKLPEMIQKAIKQAFGGEGAVGDVLSSGGGAGLQVPEGKTLDEYLDDLEQKRYERFKKQAERFGYAPAGSVSGETEPEYEGKFPIWLHPKGIPAVIDGAMDKIEKRLDKWGIIGEAAPKRKMLDMPEKPVKTKRLDLASLKKGEEEGEGEVKEGGEEAGK